MKAMQPKARVWAKPINQWKRSHERTPTATAGKQPWRAAHDNADIDVDLEGDADEETAGNEDAVQDHSHENQQQHSTRPRPKANPARPAADFSTSIVHQAGPARRPRSFLLSDGESSGTAIDQRPKRRCAEPWRGGATGRSAGAAQSGLAEQERRAMQDELDARDARLAEMQANMQRMQAMMETMMAALAASGALSGEAAANLQAVALGAGGTDHATTQTTQQAATMCTANAVSETQIGDENL